MPPRPDCRGLQEGPEAKGWGGEGRCVSLEEQRGVQGAPPAPASSSSSSSLSLLSIPPPFRPPKAGAAAEISVPEGGTFLSFVYLRVCGTFVRMMGTVTQSPMTRKRGRSCEDRGTSGLSQPECCCFPDSVPGKSAVSPAANTPSLQRGRKGGVSGRSGRGLQQEWAGRTSICGSS